VEDAKSGDPGDEQDDSEPEQHGDSFSDGFRDHESHEWQATNAASVGV
jgi:hypothetical protein